MLVKSASGRSGSDGQRPIESSLTVWKRGRSGLPSKKSTVPGICRRRTMASGTIGTGSTRKRAAWSATSSVATTHAVRTAPVVKRTCTFSVSSCRQWRAVTTTCGLSVSTPAQPGGSTSTLAACNACRRAGGPDTVAASSSATTDAAIPRTFLPRGARAASPRTGEPPRQIRRGTAAELGVQTEHLERLLHGARRLQHRVRAEEVAHLAGVAGRVEGGSRLDQARDHERRDAPAERRPASLHEAPRLLADGGIREQAHEDEGHVLGRDLRRADRLERPFERRPRAERGEVEEEAAPLLGRGRRGDQLSVTLVESL